MKIGFIGLGTMGAFMAASLQKSQYKLVVTDIRRDAAKRHLENGAEWADTPKSVAEQCDIVFTSLPGPPDVEKVVFGPDGLLAGAHAGMAYFDLSTNSQAMVRRVNAALAEKKAFGFDAPVSGGPKGAETGKLAIWVGGDKAVYEKHKKVLDAIGDQAAYIGPIGSASVAKLVHNMAGYAIQTALAEVFTMGAKAGMDPAALWKAVRQGAQGRRRTFDGLPRQFLVDKYSPPDFALKLAHKDAPLQPRTRGDERGAQSRLGRSRQPLADETPGRTGGRHHQVRPGRTREGAGRRQGDVELSTNLILRSRAAASRRMGTSHIVAHPSRRIATRCSSG
jgi:3-hydroxyisobutyrate dehydrogenase-like beta-hydroxyacid dehydrogenase